MIKLKCNCCDVVYNSFDVHFISACDNNCRHCIGEDPSPYGHCY